MDFSSLHVCMESSNQWLQGTIHEESSGMDSNSSLPSGSGNMLIQCSTTPTTESERRLRVPPHEEAAVKCPRCDSTNTKFCYYNNYSLSQPRYFCKACRRYWTKGGTLRNIPVGGVFRKTTTKKVSSKKLPNNVQSPPAAINNQNQLPHPPGPSYNHHSSKDLQLSFQNVQFSNLNKYNMGSLENPRPLNSSSYRNFDYFENSDMGLGVGLGDMSSNYNGLPLNYHGLCSPAFLGMSLEGSSNAGNYTMDSYQRLMLPYDMGGGDNPNGSIDVKPNPKLLSLEWQDQGCSGVEKDSFGYLNGSGSWNGVMNGYGSSTTNPSVYN